MKNDDLVGKRTEFVGFYVNKEEKEKLQTEADKMGMGLSGYLRYVTMYKEDKRD